MRWMDAALRCEERVLRGCGDEKGMGRDGDGIMGIWRWIVEVCWCCIFEGENEGGRGNGLWI